MIIVTTGSITGKPIVRTLGFVRGNSVRTRHLDRDILALFKNLVGREVHEYAKLLAESREHALDRHSRRGATTGSQRHRWNSYSNFLCRVLMSRPT